MRKEVGPPRLLVLADIAKIAGVATLAVMGLEGVQGVKRHPRVKMFRGLNRSRG